MIPADGGYAVAAAAASAGTAPQVLQAGSYRTADAPSECYWEINDQHGNIIDNNFVTSAPGGITVTLSAGQGFDSRGCGNWVPAS